MRRLLSVGTALLLSSAWAGAQDAPQTPRQALMEMLFSKEPGTFMKHLPSVTRAALEKSGTQSNLQPYAMFTSQLQAQGKSFQTFETGPVLVATADPKTGQKFEVVVESDAKRGDRDDIELSFRTYKDNVAQKSPFIPRLVCSMKMEAGHWTLNEIAFSLHVPLDDPEVWKDLKDRMQPHTASATPQIQMQSQGQTLASPSNDGIALAAVRKILAAETTYASTYSSVGYTCTLSDLDGFGAAEANQHQAMLIGSSLASGKHQGYSFSLTGCAGAPAAHFRLTATPIGESYGRRAFCSDESGAVRASADGNPATCASSGTVVP